MVKRSGHATKDHQLQMAPYRIGIATHLHTPQLKPAPVEIKLCGPDKRTKPGVIISEKFTRSGSEGFEQHNAQWKQISGNICATVSAPKPINISHVSFWVRAAARGVPWFPCALGQGDVVSVPL